MTVVPFYGARRRLFHSALREINRTFHDKIAKTKTWPVDWFTPDYDDVDPSNYEGALKARNEHVYTAIAFLCRKRLSDCLAVARKYGANAEPFERAWQRRYGE